jgi:hypothetical protein
VSRQHVERVPPDDFERALPEPELIDGEEAYEVEAIIGERLHSKAKGHQFRVKWQHWPITVVTDHQPILQVVSSNSKTLTSPRVERWRMLLQPYMGQMTFVHKAGWIRKRRLDRHGREERKREDSWDVYLGKKGM